MRKRIRRVLSQYSLFRADDRPSAHRIGHDCRLACLAGFSAPRISKRPVRIGHASWANLLIGALVSTAANLAGRDGLYYSQIQCVRVVILVLQLYSTRGTICNLSAYLHVLSARTLPK